ncbi:MAG: SCP2 sterol-binding domain-containing protein [Candidatus Geothermincolia bacterium]
MPVFESQAKMYDVLGTLFNLLADDATVGPKFNAEKINLQFIINDPDGEIWLLNGDPKPTVKLGSQTDEAQVQMWIAGDDCHDFWLKKLNLPVALAKKKVSAKGPMAKVLALLPLLNPAYEAYPGIAKDNGLPV